LLLDYELANEAIAQPMQPPHKRTTFGLRGAGAPLMAAPAPVAAAPGSGRWRRRAIYFALPLIAFLAVRLITGRGTFTFYVTTPGGTVTMSGDDLDLSQLLDRCSGKNGASPDMQIAACTALIQSGRGNDHGLSVAFYDRGNAYRQKHDYDRAIADYDQAIRHNSGMGVAFSNRGNVYRQQGQYARALADYDAAIRLDPKDAIALQNRCWVRFVTGQLSEALADCDESLRLRPDAPLALNARGLVHLKMGAAEKAGADFDAALAKSPKMASALYGRGLLKRRQGGAGDADIAAATAIEPAIAERFARYGVN
jgi:tetratricopeptide (TPR) repeat protein